MPFKSNITEFVRVLEYRSNLIRFDEDLGERIEAIFGDRMVERVQQEMAPDGSYWPANNPEYAARKGGLPVGILTGDMLSSFNIRGRATITESSVRMSYAGSGFARAKLGWFAASGRVAWGMDSTMRAAFRDAVRDHARRRLKD